MGQGVERRGAVGVAAGQLFLAAQPGGQIAGDDGDGEVEEEEDDVLSARDLQREARLDKQEVPRKSAQRGRQ